MSQLNLWQDGTKRQMFVPDVPINVVRISELNPRHTRNEKRIGEIAELITRNGFDQTCAPKAISIDGRYQVFAGGNRYMAAQKAGCERIPIYLYEGYTDQEIWKLAYDDNEQASKHDKVSDVDVWLDYKSQKERGNWTQQEMADYLGVSRSIVSYRLNLAEMPQSILDIFVTTPELNERHAREILNLSPGDKLGGWMGFEAAALAVISKVLARTKTPTAKQFADEVADTNKLIALAGECYGKLHEEYQTAYVNELVKTKAASKSEVTSAYNTILRRQLADAKRVEEEAARKASQAEQERLRVQRETQTQTAKEAVLSKLVHGDSRQQAKTAPYGIKLLLTDPPYGKDFQSNRRVASNQAPKLVNDDSKAFDVFADVMKVAYSKMADNSFAIVWTDWQHYSEFERIVLDVGLEIRSVIVWDKPNHGSGDLEGAPAPKHEWAIFAVKGNPKLNENSRFDNVLTGSTFIGTEHPTEKPIDLLEILIKATTSESDIVADPFAGGGSTPITAFKLHRDFWACEIDEHWYAQAKDKLFDAVEEKFDA